MSLQPTEMSHGVDIGGMGYGPSPAIVVRGVFSGDKLLREASVFGSRWLSCRARLMAITSLPPSGSLRLDFNAAPSSNGT